MRPGLILAIIGHPAAGKDTIARHLASRHGFGVVSASDELRRLGATARDDMRALARQTRMSAGDTYFAQWALAQASQAAVAIVGLRTVPEVQCIQAHRGLVLGVNAGAAIRFERSLIRGRPGDPRSETEFFEQERAEAAGQSPIDPNVAGALGVSNALVSNEGTFYQLYQNLDNLMAWIA